MSVSFCLQKSNVVVIKNLEMNEREGVEEMLGVVWCRGVFVVRVCIECL